MHKTPKYIYQQEHYGIQKLKIIGARCILELQHLSQIETKFKKNAYSKMIFLMYVF